MILTWESRYLLVLFYNTSWNIFSLSFATFLMRVFPQLGNCTSSINFFCSSKVRATVILSEISPFSLDTYYSPIFPPTFIFFILGRSLHLTCFTGLWLSHWDVMPMVTSFSTNVPLLYPLKTSENLGFICYQGYISGTWLKMGYDSFIGVNVIRYTFMCRSLRKKCPYLELFWSVFSPNAGKYGPK